MQTHDFHHISPTAKLVAYMRAMSDVPYSQQIAAMCDAEATAQSFYNGNMELPRKRAPLAELRYKSLSGILANLPYENIIELASGLSPRGLILTQNPNVRFVETDLPGILQDKQEIVKDLLGSEERPEYHFASANALDAEEFMVAARNLRPGPAAIVHEGLLPYLNTEEKKRLAANIMGLLNLLAGAWVTPDILTREQHEKTMAKSLANQKIKATTGRDIQSNLFDDFDDAEKFFNGVGFKVERHQQLKFAGRISCPVLDTDTEEQIENQEIWVMRPI
jgi:O-methyltransferase involved in polyketide biosynthesis